MDARNCWPNHQRVTYQFLGCGDTSLISHIMKCDPNISRFSSKIGSSFSRSQKVESNNLPRCFDTCSWMKIRTNINLILGSSHCRNHSVTVLLQNRKHIFTISLELGHVKTRIQKIIMMKSSHEEGHLYYDISTHRRLLKHSIDCRWLNSASKYHTYSCHWAPP